MSGHINITFATAIKLAKALQVDFMPELRDKETKESVSDAKAEYMNRFIVSAL